MERGARTSGSRFGYLTGDIARLWWAISRMALDTLADGGFTPVIPPVMVREEAMYATGFFPTDRQSVYALSDDDLFLVGTSEVPLAAFHAGEMLAEAELPLRYAGLSSCFRREAGAAGRDTRGIFRLHQFEKVEMFSFCHPDKSWDEHLHLLAIEESIAQTLGLTGREVFEFGDLQGGAARLVKVTARPDDGRAPIQFEVRVRIDTPKEREYYRHGGILQYVLRQIAAS
jgi:seryl-tRNA synthetase